MIDSVSEAAGATADLKKARRQKAARPDSRPTIDRLPPHDEGMERGVLGCILLSPNECLPEVLSKLKSKLAFYDLRNQTIFTELEAMRRELVPIDVITLTQRLKDAGLLEQIGGIAYLSRLQDEVPSAANLSYYLDVVKEKHELRRIIETCTSVVGRVYEFTGTIDELKFSVQSDLGDVFADGAGADGLTVRTPAELLALRFDDDDIILGDRLLSDGGKCALLGASGAGKSRLLLQFVACQTTSRKFLIFDTFKAGIKWLWLQTENSNRRLNLDLARVRAWIGEDDYKLFSERVLIHTIETDADGFVNLDDPEAVAKIDALIQTHKPDCIIIDPLVDFGIGDLSKDVDMKATLQSLSRLCRHGNPQRGVIVLHHALTGKAGAVRATGYDRASFARNSKVLHAWARSAINVAAVDSANNDRLIIGCGKCSDAREFQTFAVCLNPETMIYECDPTVDVKQWEQEMAGKKDEPLMTVDRVAELCTGAMTKSELAAKIRQDCGCGKTASFNWVQRAGSKGKIHWTKATETYVRKP